MHDTVRTMLTTIQKSDWSAYVSETAQTVVHYNYTSTSTLIILTLFTHALLSCPVRFVRNRTRTSMPLS